MDDGERLVRVAQGGEQCVHPVKRKRGGRPRRAGAGWHAAPLVVNQRREEGVCAASKGLRRVAKGAQGEKRDKGAGPAESVACSQKRAEHDVTTML